MSRKFAKEEIIIHKCNVCGARNKLFKKIDNKKFTITCCNCGHFVTFRNDPSMNIPGLNDLDKMLNDDNEVCIRLTFCRNKKCRYYKKGSNDSSNNKKNKSCSCNNNCDCCCDCCTTQSLDNDVRELLSKKSDIYQLDINEKMESNPRFH